MMMNDRPERKGRDSTGAGTGPAPADDKDRGSRDQIRPAVRLYGVLRDEMGQEEALQVVAAVVLPATIVFLEHAIGGLDPAAYGAADEDGRRAYADRIMAPFPNADAESAEAGDRHFVQHVTRCRFVELCAAAGVPELAPVFCAGDLAFFEQGEIELTRPTTLAEGGPYCDFRFSLRDR